jgi:hypothetical protein
MRRKLLWLTLVTLLIALLAGVGVVQAQESPSYDLSLNSLAGGMQGGKTLTSASYTLVVNMGSVIQVSSTSAGYELCSGFVCQSDKSFFQMRLPTLNKSSGD